MIIRSRKYLDGSRGQPCAFSAPGICNANPETVVFAHLNGAAFGKAMGRKAHDIAGLDACYACHAYIDTGHGTNPLMSEAEFTMRLLRGVVLTMINRASRGIIVIPLDAEHLHHDKPVKPRKPPAERRPVPAGKPLQSRSEFPKGRKIATRPIRRDA